LFSIIIPKCNNVIVLEGRDGLLFSDNSRYFFYTARIFKKKLYGLREAQEFLVQDSQVKQCRVSKYGRDNR